LIDIRWKLFCPVFCFILKAGQEMLNTSAVIETIEKNKTRLFERQLLCEAVSVIITEQGQGIPQRDREIIGSVQESKDRVIQRGTSLD
jgi:hypothetical protein